MITLDVEVVMVELLLEVNVVASLVELLVEFNVVVSLVELLVEVNDVVFEAMVCHTLFKNEHCEKEY